MFYTVSCSALGETETTSCMDQAMDLCFSMSEESGSYATITDQFGNLIGEYGAD